MEPGEVSSYLEAYLAMMWAELPRAGPMPALATGLAGAGVLACLVFSAQQLRRRGDLLADLSLEHARGGALQACCAALLYNAGPGAPAAAAYQLLTFLALLTPFWTLCTALLVFSNLFMFRNQDPYCVGQVARFALIFTTAVHLCEELFGFALAILALDLRDEFGPTLGAIRLTSMLLVKCAPAAVLGVGLTRAPLNPSTLLLLLHVLSLLVSDVLSVVYQLTDYRNPTPPHWSFVLFCVKPILEMVWYMLVRHCMRRYLSKEDLYLP